MKETMLHMIVHVLFSLCFRYICCYSLTLRLLITNLSYWVAVYLLYVMRLHAIHKRQLWPTEVRQVWFLSDNGWSMHLSGGQDKLVSISHDFLCHISSCMNWASGYGTADWRPAEDNGRILIDPLIALTLIPGHSKSTECKSYNSILTMYM